MNYLYYLIGWLRNLIFPYGRVVEMDISRRSLLEMRLAFKKALKRGISEGDSITIEGLDGNLIFNIKD